MAGRLELPNGIGALNKSERKMSKVVSTTATAYYVLLTTKGNSFIIEKLPYPMVTTMWPVYPSLSISHNPSDTR